jgi:hypothetical protein
MKRPYPKSLYKYRSFSVRTLRLLAQAEIYYSDPKDFNDPLDCNPTIEIDLDRRDLVKLFAKMRMAQLRKNGKTGEDAKALVKDDYNRIFYSATEDGHPDTGPDANRYLLRLLADEIRGDLEAEMKSHGVLSLSARWDNPLLWSHYADEHRGLCIEYDTDEVSHPGLRAVTYGGARAIKTSCLSQWKLGKDQAAGSTVFDTYFLTKAVDWRYEKEWRDIGSSIGINDTSYRVKSVTFGLRCDSAVVTAVIMLFEGHGSVDFYSVYPRGDKFSLNRYRLDADEHRQFGIRSSAVLDFKDVFLPELDERSGSAD